MEEERTEALRPHSKWLIFAVVGLANLTAAFSVNSITLALPLLAKEFGVSQGDVSWLALVYSLIPCCLLLIFGRLGDLLGYRRQIILGFLLFGTVSFLAPLFSRNLGALILFRCLQGVGYSVLVSITQAVVGRTFDITERGRALGVNSVFVSVGLAAGPSLGGLILTHLGWQAIFFINVPFCLLGALSAGRFMPKDEKVGKGLRNMDWLGALFFALAIGPFAVGINFSDDWGLRSPYFIGSMAVSALMLLLFLLRERRAKTPLMSLSLFRNRTFTLANSASMLSYLTQQMTTFLTPFFLVNVLLLSTDRSGWILFVTPLAMMICSPLGGYLMDKRGVRLPAAIGLILIFAGCLAMSRLDGGVRPAAVAFILLFFGIGNGFSVSAINTTILSAVPRSQTGVGSGMLATVRNLGQTLGVACGSIIVGMEQARWGDSAMAAETHQSEIYLSAIHDAFTFALIVVCAALLLILIIPARSGEEGVK